MGGRTVQMSTAVVCAVTLFSCRDLVRFRMNLRLPFSVYRVSSDPKMEIARSSVKSIRRHIPKTKIEIFTFMITKFRTQVWTLFFYVI